MVGIKNHANIFCLFSFADLQSPSDHNNRGVCFGPFHQNVASFQSSVAVNFNVKLKVYLYMHGNNDNFLVL